MPNLPADFPGRLTALRRRASLGQSELARRAEMSRSQVRNYEAGRSEPTLSALLKLATALGVTPGDFFP